MSNTDEKRWQQRLANFEKAFAQLDTACQKTSYSDLELAGLVQMFEFSFELAWKTLKDFLFYEGFDEKTPREVLRRGFEVGLLSETEAETALDALSKRNLLTHTYNEATAKGAVQLIKDVYTPMLKTLLVTLRKRLSNP